jgi:hypothetical protein
MFAQRHGGVNGLRRRSIADTADPIGGGPSGVVSVSRASVYERSHRESIAVILSIAIALVVCAVGFSLLLVIALGRAATRGDAYPRERESRGLFSGRRGPLTREAGGLGLGDAWEVGDAWGLGDARGPSIAATGPRRATTRRSYATRQSSRQSYTTRQSYTGQSYAGMTRARAMTARSQSATAFAGGGTMPAASGGQRRHAHTLTASRAI